MAASPDPLKSFSVSDTLQACQGTRDVGDIDDQGALRVLASSDDGGSFELVPYTGQPYVAISYCWGGDDFRKVGTSNTPSLIQTPSGPILSTHFSQFMARAAAIYNAGRPERTMWIDYHCINQSDADEKMSQVAIMQRIYARAVTTLVMVEDVGLSPEDRAALLDFSAHDEAIRLIRPIISARWFTRAWCSQELVLSRKAVFFFHNTSSPETPLEIDSDRLWHVVDIARNYDASIPLFNVPRGIVPVGALTRTNAYALGIVRHLGCSDEYDKVSLLCNLQRDVYRFTARPGAFHADPSAVPTIQLNVLKMANVLAVLRRDFSTLVANHSADNPLRGVRGFGWAGCPVHGDRISEMWLQKDYEAHRDPDATVDSAALVVRGIVARIEHEHVWELRRTGDGGGGLHAVVDGTAHPVSPDILPASESWAWTRDAQLLRDLLRALFGVATAARHSGDVARHARIALAYLLAEPDYQLQPEPLPEDGRELAALLERVLRGTVGPLRDIATALQFVRRDDGRVLFSTVLLSEGSVVLVSGNGAVAPLSGCLLFQPFVVRPKLFSPPMVLTANSMVLEREAREDGTYLCVGCVRGLGMVAEASRDGERQLRVV